MPSHAQACWIETQGRAALRIEPLAEPGPHDVVVRALYSGISRGTESLVFRGEVPPGESARMRAPFQSGEFPAPVKYGYSSVGVVESGPPALSGRTVFCLYPHQDRYVVPAEAVHPLPQGLPPGRAVLAANAETALNGLWDAAPLPGDRIVVVGAGVVGLLVGWLAARIPGCEVQVVEPDPTRAQMARALGCEAVDPAAARGGADLVVHASGSAEGLATALSLAGFEATVLELSWYGTRAVRVPLGEAFHAQRLVLRSSQVGHVAPRQRPRWTHAQRLALALELLRDDRLDALLGAPHPFETLPSVLARLAQAPGAVACERIVYP
jgi:2-desacetyl-2-hydroxyethyl bacteriochlorophyllide A dehydrogenase